MEKISNRALISRLYASANHHLEETSFDTESWSQWYQVVQGLTGPEKMVYVIVNLNKGVTNGGFAEFYESSFGIFSPEIIHVLSEIKAVQSADIVASTLSIVNPKGLLDEMYKESVFSFQLSEEQKVELHAQDVRYDQLQDHENLEDLLGGYLQAAVD
ncbi:MAG: DUF4375 domain-containing protein [Saprospiraceae bacterium]